MQTAAETIAAEQDAKAMLTALREVVRRAWQTLAQVPDPDLRFLKHTCGWIFPVINTVQEAYGYSSARARKFKPTAEDVSRMEIVMVWMAWLRRTEGDGSIRRISSWAMGVPTWMIGERERCSERTVLNRMDRSLAAVLRQFLATDIDAGHIEEPVPSDPIRGFSSPLQAGDHSEGIHPGKVWIDGIGWMFRGKVLNRGEHLAEKIA